MIRLYYRHHLNDDKAAKKYYRMTISKDNWQAMYNLAEKYYLMAKK
jgi:hypothetical protein